MPHAVAHRIFYSINFLFMQQIRFIIILLCLSQSIKAQTIKGSVMDAQSRKPLSGSTIRWITDNKATTADAGGVFEIAYPVKVPNKLIATYVGYVSDTIAFNSQTEIHFMLKPSAVLEEVEVRQKKDPLDFNTIDPINRQSIGKVELQKAACCNLSESFETNATVDVSYADALTGTKQIKMLGLDGSYTQILTEQAPSIRGLSTNYGLAHIPGTWVQAIDITKGMGSVVQGYESMAGQINIELAKPEKSERLFVNLYAGDLGRYEANVHLGHRLNKRWSTLLLTHASTIATKNDFNKDGFIDVATGYQFSALNRWKYENPGKLMSSFGVFANTDQRNGGQLNYSGMEDNINKRYYGVDVRTNHIEGFGKAAIGFEGMPYKSLSFQVDARYYEQQSVYGAKSYNGNEQTLYGNMVYQTIIGSSEHKIKTGASFMYDNFNERYIDSAFKRTEIIPGAFAEYNYDRLNKFSLLAGVRTDYHNLFGVLVNPRLHMKYNFSKTTVFRLNAGRGMRVANIMIEHPAVLASMRTVVVQERFTPEIAWNYGASFTHKFKIWRKNATWVTDYFYTNFENQVVADMDQSANAIYFYNLKGKSYSQTFQTEFVYEPIIRFEARLAWKWQDVKTTYNGTLLDRPLVSRNRILVNLAYATRFDKWKFDLTGKWFDRSRVPTTFVDGTETRYGFYSPDYMVLNAQATRKFKKFELYAGVENIFNFIQQNQIVDAANPFGPNFDASLIWGPIMGRVLYAGFRMAIR